MAGVRVSSQLEEDARRGREWDTVSVKGGVGGLSPDVLPFLSVFCCAYAHLLTVMDDDEFQGRKVGGGRVLGLRFRVYDFEFKVLWCGV